MKTELLKLTNQIQFNNLNLIKFLISTIQFSDVLLKHTRTYICTHIIH